MSQITLTLPNATRRVNTLRLQLLEPFSKSAGTGPEICFWPLKPADVLDRRNLRLVFLSPLHPHLSPETIPFVNELSSLSDVDFRRFKKTMLLIAMDERAAAGLMLHPPLSDPGIDVSEVLSSYKFVGFLAHKGLRWKNFGHLRPGAGEGLVQNIMDFAIAEKIVLDEVSPRVLAKHLALEKDNPYEVAPLFDRFLCEPKLPMIRSADVFETALRTGIGSGFFKLTGTGSPADLKATMAGKDARIKLVLTE